MLIGSNLRNHAICPTYRQLKQTHQKKKIITYGSYNKVVNENQLLLALLHRLHRHIVSFFIVFGLMKTVSYSLYQIHTGKDPQCKGVRQIFNSGIYLASIFNV